MREYMIFTIAACAIGFAAVAGEPIANLRGAEPVTSEPPAPHLDPFDDENRRQVRNYPEQPPVILMISKGTRIDLNSNKCLSCHARSRTGESGAPMVSITHFMDRDAQFRAAVTPRRYFCNQCHVAQRDLKPLVGNTFVDIDTLLGVVPAVKE